MDYRVTGTERLARMIFAGELDKSGLGLGERLITRVVKAPAGDFRDWETIRAWTHEIAMTLATPAGVHQ